MAMWDKLKVELDKAGRVAQDAIDEGKIRLEAFRVRQMADKAAQALGYAVYRARKSGQELDTDSYARLSSALAGHEAEAAGLEAQLAEVAARAKAERTADTTSTAGGAPPTP